MLAAAGTALAPAPPALLLRGVSAKRRRAPARSPSPARAAARAGGPSAAPAGRRARPAAGRRACRRRARGRRAAGHRDVDLGAVEQFPRRDDHVGLDVVVAQPVDVVGHEPQRQQQVARRPAVARLAEPAQPDHLAVASVLRDRQLDVALALRAAEAAARRARAALDVAVAIAVLARHADAQPERPLAAQQRLADAQLDLGLLAAARRARARAAVGASAAAAGSAAGEHVAEHLREEVREPAAPAAGAPAEHARELLGADVAEPAAAAGRRLEVLAVPPVLAERVVPLALLGIAEHLVCLRDRLEPVLDLLPLVRRMAVGMPF